MYEKYIDMRDSIASENTRRKIIEDDFKFTYEKKVAEDRVKAIHEKKVNEARANARLEKEQLIKYFLYAGLALTIIFGFFMFNRFRVTHRQKNIIEEQKIVVEKQKKLVEEKQEEMMDSIRYAKRIQQSQMPSENQVHKQMKRLRNK
jgi:hypothetical protein